MGWTDKLVATINIPMTSLWSAVSRMNETAFQKLFTIVEIHGFILPLGSGADEYLVRFEFDEALEKLSSGILVQPRLVLYAGRDDMDRTLLARRIETEFQQAFQEAKQSLRRKTEAGSQQILSDQQALNERGAQAFSGLVIALVGMFLAANPLIDLIFLLMAVLGGKQAVHAAFQYVSMIPRMVTHQQQVGAQMREVEKTFSGKEGVFDQAVQNLVIRLHSNLRQLCSDLCEVDGMKRFQKIERSVDEPGVKHHINSEAYKKALDDVYHNLLD